MTRAAPPWIAYRASLDDAERYAAMTPEERLEIFVEVCELARTILEERPDRARVLAESEPMPPAAAAAWRRLVAESRRDRAAG
jgi:anaerobic ribonucleoside-triphosphate reductase